MVPVGDDGQRVDVTFLVEENFKVQVRRINIVGNDFLTDAQIKAMIQTREGNELFITKRDFQGRAFSNRPDEDSGALLRLRIRSIKVGQPTVTLTPDRRYIDISIPLTEGVQYSIGDITFAGDVELRNDDNEVVVDEEILRKFIASKKGEMFKRTTLFEDIGRLSNVYKNRGYAFAANSKMRMKNWSISRWRSRRATSFIDRIEISANRKPAQSHPPRNASFEGELYSEAGINASKARIFQRL